MVQSFIGLLGFVLVTGQFLRSKTDMHLASSTHKVLRIRLLIIPNRVLNVFRTRLLMMPKWILDVLRIRLMRSFSAKKFYRRVPLTLFVCSFQERIDRDLVLLLQTKG